MKYSGVSAFCSSCGAPKLKGVSVAECLMCLQGKYVLEDAERAEQLADVDGWPGLVYRSPD